MIKELKAFTVAFIGTFFIMNCTYNAQDEKDPLKIDTTYSVEYKEVRSIQIPNEITIKNIAKEEESRLYITLNNEDNILFIEPSVNSNYSETFTLTHNGINSPTEITINANKKKAFKPEIILFDQDFSETDSFNVVRNNNPQTFYYHINSFLNDHEFSYSHSDNIEASLSESEIIIRYKGKEEDTEGNLTIQATDSDGRESTLNITLNFID